MYYIDNIEVLIIFNVIKDVFYRFNLFFDCICGQCYDMVVFMVGLKFGVVFCIKLIEKCVVYMYCYGYVFNFVCNDVIRGCRII